MNPPTQFPKTVRIWQCDVCGKTGQWTNDWASYSSIKDDEEGNRIVVCSKTCQAKCDAPMMWQRKFETAATESKPMTFTLESQPQTQPPPTCGTCVHYRPHRDPETNRVHPSKHGTCGWSEPFWPIGIQRPFLLLNRIWRNTDATKCQCYKPLP